MRKLAASGFVAGVAAAAAIGLSAPPALAATWEVLNSNPDGVVSLQAGQTTWTVHSGSGDVAFVCQSSDGTGTFPPDQSDGLAVGTIDSLNFRSCLLGGSIPVTIVPSGFPWPLDALSQSGDIVTGEIPAGIGVHFSSTTLPCEFDVSGPADSNDGSMPWTYDNVASQLIFNGGGNLTSHNVAPGECADLLDNGASAEFFATYDVIPPVEINLIAP